jgi:hypothetical protein
MVGIISIQLLFVLDVSHSYSRGKTVFHKVVAAICIDLIILSATA